MKHEQEEQARETMSETRFYLAGVRACRLAEIVLNSKPNKNELRLATDVLRDFGIVFDTSHLPGGEEETTGATEAAPEPPAQQELHWPPAAPDLPAVYMTHEYVVREEGARCFIASSDAHELHSRYLHSRYLNNDPNHSNLNPGERLRYTGQASFAGGVWWFNVNRISDDAFFWVRSKDIKPTAELPKQETP